MTAIVSAQVLPRSHDTSSRSSPVRSTSRAAGSRISHAAMRSRGHGLFQDAQGCVQIEVHGGTAIARSAVMESARSCAKHARAGSTGV